MDKTLDLKTGTYRPYRKSNDAPLYIHASSKHPQQILKQLPLSINQHLSRNSSNSSIFDQCKDEYEVALKRSGYKRIHLSYIDNQRTKRKNNSTRNTIWFNPPFSRNVSSNIANHSSNSLTNTSPPPPRTIFTKFSTKVKVNYSCTANVHRIIKSHNMTLSNASYEPTKDCNCKPKTICPLQRNHGATSLVFKWDVDAPNVPRKTYLGMTEGEFKKRFNDHKLSLNNNKYANTTTLLTYIWNLKNTHNIIPTLSWSILHHAISYSNNGKSCHLCLTEKFAIMSHPSPDTVNKRSELISKCRHSNKHLLTNYLSND